MTIEAVLFDLDGTLIDSTEAIVASFFHTFDEIGEPRPPRDAIMSTISIVLEEQFRLLTDADPEKCTKIYRTHYVETAAQGTDLLPGAEDILTHCREAGARVGFVTSKRRSSSEPLLDALGILHHFEVRVGPEDVSRPKPDPEPLHLALSHLDLPPERAVYVGDTPLDVGAAAAASMRCVAVTTGYATPEALRESGAKVVLPGLVDAREWLASAGLAT